LQTAIYYASTARATRQRSAERKKKKKKTLAGTQSDAIKEKPALIQAARKGGKERKRKAKGEISCHTHTHTQHLSNQGGKTKIKKRNECARTPTIPPCFYEQAKERHFVCL
jgi:uncharacterized protein (DUF1800 family)